MEKFNWKDLTVSWDDRRNIVVSGDSKSTVEFCVKQFIQIARKSISERQKFVVALSGGSTPNAMYHLLSQSPYKDQLDWSKVFLFWSDERCVLPDHPDSNFHASMEAGLSKLPIPKKNIFRMKGEMDPAQAAEEYEKEISTVVPSKKFDLVMLGMGEDGHTASLFPHTKGLHNKGQLAIANYIPQKKVWRISLTYECIHLAHQICIYVIGKNKADMVAKSLLGLYQPDELPIQRVGSSENKALWIMDLEAGHLLAKK